MELKYLQVSTTSLHFLVPIEQMDGIVPSGGKKEGEFPVYRLAAICNLKESSNEEQYVLLFSDGDFRFGISVSQVEGILDVKSEQISIVPQEAVWEKNNYILGAVRCETLSPPLAYVLNFERLNEKRAALAPDLYL